MSSTPPAKESTRKHLGKAIRRGVGRVKSAIQPSSLLAAPGAGSASALSDRSESVSPAPSIAPSGVSPGPHTAAEESWTSNHDQSTGPSAIVTSSIPGGEKVASVVSPEALPTGRGVARMDAAWLGLGRALRGLGKTTEVFPPLGLAVNQLIGWVDVVQEVAANTEEYERLATELAAMLRTLDQHVTELGSEDPSGSAECIALSIKAEVDEVGKKRDRGQGRQLLESTRDKEDIIRRYRRIKGLFRQLQSEISLQVLRQAKEQRVMALLKGLFPVDDAVYNSSDSSSKRHGCTPQTREKLQQDLRDWIHDPHGAKIYWMNGMAGTGKTTIAYSLCEWLKANQKLGASFFCSRSSPSCRDFKRIVPTITYQLAKYSPRFQEALCKALEQDVDAGKLDARGQFETLLQGPMHADNVTMPDGVVVVIDALDECEEDYGVRLILGVLLQHVASLPIRFFVTSRPEPAIRDPMSSGSGYSPTVLHLHDIELSIVEEDIKKYLTEALISMSPPPTDDQIELLTKRAGKLFIYAATAVRYILPRKASTNPIARLNGALTTNSQNSQGQYSKRYKELDELYTTILTAALDEEDEVLEEAERCAIRLVLRTVVCAREPMSTPTLSTYLHLSENQVVFALESLRSVLHVSESGRLVSTLHASFPDYLCDRSRSKSFYCDPSDQNGSLAHRCFDIMKAQLRFNICDLASSFVFDQDVPNLETRIKTQISSALFYACLYWGDHLRLSGVSDVLYNKLSDFLDHRLLFWMEVLNLERRIAAGVLLLAQAEKWLQVGQTHALYSLILTLIQDTKASTSTYEYTVDSRDFVSRFTGSACNRSTPHLYISALSFCAKASFVYIRYWGRTKGLLAVRGTTMSHRNMSAQATWTIDSWVTSTAFSPDGTCIVSGSASGAVQVWDAYLGSIVVGPLEKHTDGVSSVAFCPEGRCVASGSWDHTMLLWDTYTGDVIAGPYTSHTKTIYSIAFSPDGMNIVSGSGDQTLLIWDARTCDVVSGPFQGHTRTVYAVAFSPDGRRVVSGSGDKTIRFWDVRTGETVAGPFQGHTRDIHSVAFSPDGTKVVSGSEDCTILLWDSQTGNIAAGPLTGHTDQVSSVAFSPDGTRIASGSIDTTILVWAADSGEIIAGPFTSHAWAITSLMFSPDGTRIVSGSFDRTIRLWGMGNSATSSRLERHSVHCRILSIAFSPNSTYIVSGSSDCTILVWDARTGDVVTGPFKHTGEVYSVAFSPDATHIASGSGDSTVIIWDARTGDIVVGPFTHPEQVLSVAFSPSGESIVSGSLDCTLRVWNVSTSNVIVGPLKGHTGYIGSVAFSPDGRQVASGSQDHAVMLWSTQAGEDAPKRFTGHTATVNSVAFSPDGLYIASGSSDGTIHVWDTSSDSTAINIFKGHAEPIFSVAFSPSGQRIVSGSERGIVLLWDTYTGDVVAGPLVGHECMYTKVAFSSDGSCIASGYNDGSIRVWSALANPASPEHLPGATTWENYTKAPRPETLSIASTVANPQASHPSHGTPPIVGSELPQKEDIRTISQVVTRSTMNDDGWLMLDGAPMIWVPLELHTHLPYLHNTLSIGSQGSMYFTDQSLSLGESWRECYVSQ